jgi:hypothetical protein
MRVFTVLNENGYVYDEGQQSPTTIAYNNTPSAHGGASLRNT